MDALAARLQLQRLRPLPVQLGPLLSVAKPHKECVKVGFGVHGWRVAEGINGESTVPAGVPI
jgi:hypothetical protein